MLFCCSGQPTSKQTDVYSASSVQLTSAMSGIIPPSQKSVIIPSTTFSSENAKPKKSSVIIASTTFSGEKDLEAADGLTVFISENIVYTRRLLL